MAEREEKEGFLSRLKKAAGEFLYGMATYETVRYAQESRARLESLFLLVTMGDFLGVPILHPYYAMRLLPYVVRRIEPWKRSMLREKDITDGMSAG